MNADGEITAAGWERLNEDIRILEANSLRWLRKNFLSASDEGHGSDGTLDGTFFYDPTNLHQADLIETAHSDRIDMVDTSYGDLADSVWEGTSPFSTVLGGAIHFSDDIDMDEIEETVDRARLARAKRVAGR